jgi:hypothetical protein
MSEPWVDRLVVGDGIFEIRVCCRSQPNFSHAPTSVIPRWRCEQEPSRPDAR